MWFRLTGDGDPSDLYRAADEAEKKLDPNLIKGVVHPPAEAGAMEEALAMLDNAGELLNADDLEDMQAQMEPAALKKRMRECYLQLVEAGEFVSHANHCRAIRWGSASGFCRGCWRWCRGWVTGCR